MAMHLLVIVAHRRRLYKLSVPKMYSVAAEGVFGTASKQDVMSACYLPRAGAAVAAGTRHGDIYIWCSKTHQLRNIVTAHRPGVTAPSWHTGKAMHAGVRAMALSHMQQQLVTGGADGAIMRWNIPPDGAQQLGSGLVLASVFRVEGPLGGPAPAFSALDCSPLGSPELFAGTHGYALPFADTMHALEMKCAPRGRAWAIDARRHCVKCYVQRRHHQGAGHFVRANCVRPLGGRLRARLAPKEAPPLCLRGGRLLRAVLERGAPAAYREVQHGSGRGRALGRNRARRLARGGRMCGRQLEGAAARRRRLSASILRGAPASMVQD